MMMLIIDDYDEGDCTDVGDGNDDDGDRKKILLSFQNLNLPFEDKR